MEKDAHLNSRKTAEGKGKDAELCPRRLQPALLRHERLVRQQFSYALKKPQDVPEMYK